MLDLVIRGLTAHRTKAVVKLRLTQRINNNDRILCAIIAYTICQHKQGVLEI